MNAEVLIVSGLPRSGTSVMMQLLHAGGIEAVTDSIREPDRDNPRGYYEFERVKKIKNDVAWLPEVRGKVVKMVSQLLLDLPPTERYRVLFMERDFEEMLESQEKMLQRLGRPVVPRADMLAAYPVHLARVHRWLEQQSHIAVLRIPYRTLVESPATEISRVNTFLGGRLNEAAAIEAIDPSLYRNRATNASAPASR